jgi:hypothetical protein
MISGFENEVNVLKIIIKLLLTLCIVKDKPILLFGVDIDWII